MVWEKNVPFVKNIWACCLSPEAYTITLCRYVSAFWPAGLLLEVGLLRLTKYVYETADPGERLGVVPVSLAGRPERGCGGRGGCSLQVKRVLMDAVSRLSVN